MNGHIKKIDDFFRHTLQRILLLLLAVWPGAFAQKLYFPPLTGSDWDTVSVASLGWKADSIAPLYAFLQQKNSKAFILLDHGKIALEKYFGTFTKDSLFYWASAGKTITALAAGIAQQEKLLVINDRTSKYLDTGWTVCAPAKESLITIRHQLTMTTGLNDGVADPYCTIDTSLKYLADAGTRWAYHNAPYTLLDQVIEKAAGQTLNQFLIARIGSKTGITGAFYKIDYNNVFISKARSMARFGLLILNRGVWDTATILSDTAYFNQMVNTSQDINKSYGYLWWLNGKQSYMAPQTQIVFPGSLVPDAPIDMIAALGKNGQIINVVRSRGLVFIRMGEAPGAGEVPFTLNNQIWQYLNRIIDTTTGIINSPETSVPVRISVNYRNHFIRIETPGISRNPVIEIFDMAGKRVAGPCYNRIITASCMATGVYLARIETETRRYMIKFALRK